VVTSWHLQLTLLAKAGIISGMQTIGKLTGFIAH
jgi:hypothetical protein